MAIIGKTENSITSRNSWVGMAVLFLALLGINHSISLQRTQLGLNQSAFYATPKKLLGNAFREIRVTIADILWIKVDTYFHAALTPEEHERIHPGHPEHMIGISHSTIDRAMANTQFLPLIRLITELDPNFIVAYSTGGWWLWDRLNMVPQAIDFFKEGIQNNPDNSQLHVDLAWLYFTKVQDYAKAKEELITASKMEMTDRDSASTLELLGFSYERLNDNANAIKIWEQVEKLGVVPYAAAAQRRLAELRSLPKKPGEK